jgi:YD repeat-containing protein
MDGSLDDVEVYDYDGQGNLLQRRSDDDADGSVDEVHTYRYDKDGRLLTRDIDQPDGDGHVERATHGYDPSGNLVEITFDWHRDGTVDKVWSYTYDEYGNRATWHSVRDSEEVTWLYSYDPRGRMVLEESFRADAGEDGPFHWKQHAYDAEDNRISTELYNRYRYDVHLDSRTQYGYDARGRLLRSEEFSPDGTSWGYKIRGYDCWEPARGR